MENFFILIFTKLSNLLVKTSGAPKIGNATIIYQIFSVVSEKKIWLFCQRVNEKRSKCLLHKQGIVTDVLNLAKFMFNIFLIYTRNFN